MTINDVFKDAERKMILQDKTLHIDGTSMVQFTVNVLAENEAFIFDFYSSIEEKEHYRTVLDSILDSFTYNSHLDTVTPAALTNKVVFMTTAKGMSLDPYNYINPTAIFTPTDKRLVAYMEFDQPVETELIGNWYYYFDGKKHLLKSSKAPAPYSDKFYFSIETSTQFMLADWEFELIAGDIVQTIPFKVLPRGGTYNIKVYMDGIQKSFDVSPTIRNNSTLVPLRGIFEELGAAVSWEEVTKTVTATKGDKIVKLKNGDSHAMINGEKVALATKAQAIGGRTMVPLRFVSEALGANVTWDSKTQSIFIKQ